MKKEPNMWIALLIILLVISLVFGFRDKYRYYSWNFGEGESMCPTLGNWSIMIYEPVRTPDFEVGEIYKYHVFDNGVAVYKVHRYMGIKEGLLEMKGDNNDFSELVSKDVVISKIWKFYNLRKCDPT